ARVSQLLPGRYQVTITHNSFASATVDTQVASGNATTVAILLAVAAASQQVEIIEQAPTINTVNAQLQQTTDAQAMNDLPLLNSTAAGSSAGVVGLAATAPGEIPVTPNNPFLGVGSYNSNGGRGRGNNITIDNATATDAVTTGAVGTGTVPLDAIKEFNVITNQFNAEFGRNSSSQAQILTKNGANDFHGELFEFFRNSALNARDYFSPLHGATPNINNDWGALAGGAIVKNKLFYFGTYEQQTIRGSGGTRIATVPTPAQAASAVPIAQQILREYNVPLSATGQIAQTAPNTSDFLGYSGRLDYNITDKDVFFARFGEAALNASSTGNTFIDSNLAQNGASAFNRAWNVTLSETHIFGPAAVNNFLASYSRNAPVFTPLVGNASKPEIMFGDSTSNFGTWDGFPQDRIQNTFQYQDIVTRVAGKHTIKAGAGVDRLQANSSLDALANGAFTFLTLSDFLNGNPFQYRQIFGSSERGNRVWNEFFFVQDDWRATRTLTFNIGFREEIAGGVTEVNGILSNIDPNLTSAPLGSAGSGPLGSFYTGGSYFHTNHNPGPRFGFAWNPGGGKTVIRGGYGIAYDFIYLNPITNGRFQPPFMYLQTLPQGQVGVGANSIANILAGTSPFQAQGAAEVGTFSPSIENYGTIAYVDPNLKNPQVQQFTFTIERQLFSRWLIRAGYSGTKGNYLQNTVPLNFIRPGLYTPPATLAEQTAEQKAGVFSAINAASLAGSGTPSNRIDPRFDNVSAITSGANSNYHSFQFYTERRFADWYMFTAAYTWSKSIDDVSDALNVIEFDSPNQQDPFNNRNNRAVSGFDVPRRIVITHDFVSKAGGIDNRWVRNLLNGWEFSGIFQAQSGIPANLMAGTVAGLTDGTLLGGNGAQRPNLVGPLNLHFQPNPGLGANNPNLIQNSGLAQPLVGQFGTLGRNVVRVNPFIESDMALGRIFKLKPEGMTLKIQAQVFNVFNNTTFGSLGLSLSAPATFGYYSGTDTNSRRVALTARLIW
ncbi:MAG: hypothetical protein ACRD30_08865, partial [Bryobacteraceae bacterium]